VIVVCFVSVFVSFGVAVVVWFRLGLFFALLGLWLFALLMTQQDCFLTLLHAAAIAAGVCCVCVFAAEQSLLFRRAFAFCSRRSLLF
jgi:hypothetical protein